MRHVARRRPTHVRSWVPPLLLLGAGLGALGLAVVVLLTVSAAPGGIGGEPEPRLAAARDHASPAGDRPAQAEADEAETVEAEAVDDETADPWPVRPPSVGVDDPRAARWAAGLLARWDRARERAWRAADPVALRALYVPGSTAAQHDAELLERWTRAGVEVAALRLRVDRLEILALHPGRVVVEVTDRLRVRAVAGQTPLRLGRDRPSTRVVALRRDDDTWRVARVLPTGAA